MSDSKESDSSAASEYSLLTCPCYAGNVTNGIHPFVPVTITNEELPQLYVPCVYSRTRFTELLAGVKKKHMEQSKIFEYMCMTHLVHNCIHENENINVEVIPSNLLDIYKESKSVTPFFRKRFQPYKFITDNTALNDIDLRFFYDCQGDAEVATAGGGVTLTGPFLGMSGVDIKVNNSDSYIEGADFIRNIDKYLKVARGDGDSGSFLQIVGIKRHERIRVGQAEIISEFVYKVYMYKITPDTTTALGFPSDLGTQNEIYDLMADLKISRIIFDNIHEKGLVYLGKTEQAILDEIIENDTKPAMRIILENMRNQEVMLRIIRKCIQFINENENESLEKISTAVSIETLFQDPEFPKLKRGRKGKINKLPNLSEKKKKMRYYVLLDAYTAYIEGTLDELSGLLNFENRFLGFKPCGLQRTYQLKFSPRIACELIGDADHLSVIYNLHEHGSQDEFPSLLFGPIGRSAKTEARIATLQPIQAADQVPVHSNPGETKIPEMSTIQAKGYLLVVRFINHKLNNGRPGGYKNFIDLMDEPGRGGRRRRRDFKIDFQMHLNRVFPAVHFEFDDVNHILNGAYDYLKNKHKYKISVDTQTGSGKKIIKMKGGNYNKIKDLIIILFLQLYSITNLNDDVVNRNENNPIWEIIIQLVRNMNAFLRGIQIPIIGPIQKIVGRHIEKSDEPEFYELVYEPVNSVITNFNSIIEFKDQKERQIAKSTPKKKVQRTRHGSELRLSGKFSTASRNMTPKKDKTRREVRRLDSMAQTPQNQKPKNKPSRYVVRTPPGGGRKKRTRKKRRKKKKSRRKRRK